MYKYQIKINHKNEVIEIRTPPDYVMENEFITINHENPNLDKERYVFFWGYKYIYKNGSIIENDSEEFLNLKKEIKLNNLRAIRNNFLEKTDFIMLKDSPFTEEQKMEMEIYRKKLRDITQTIDINLLLNNDNTDYDELEKLLPKKPSFLKI